MAALNPAKRRAKDAVAHHETAAQVRFLKGNGNCKASSPLIPAAKPPLSKSPVKGSLLRDLKRQAMDAIANVETVSQIGVLKMTAGVVAYVGRIREMDRENMRRKAQSRNDPHQRPARVERLGRDYG